VNFPPAAATTTKTTAGAVRIH